MLLHYVTMLNMLAASIIPKTLEVIWCLQYHHENSDLTKGLLEKSFLFLPKAVLTISSTQTHYD